MGSPLIFEILSLPALKFGTPGGAVGSDPALQAGRSPVRFAMVSLELSITAMRTTNIPGGGGVKRVGAYG
jgi:hypothetical protein